MSIAISDKGVGMDGDFVRNRLFQPFASTKPGGFGIGAFEARSLIAAMGGRLSVDSRPGQGTTFTILLPAAEPAGTNRNGNAHDRHSQPPSAARRRGRRGPAAPAQMGLRRLSGGLRRRPRPARSRRCALHEPAVVTLDLGLPPDPDGTDEGFATLAGDPAAQARHQGHRRDRPRRARKRAEGDRAWAPTISTRSRSTSTSSA